MEIAKWFNEPESTFYKHPRSPHPDVFRVSNDRSEGCTSTLHSLSGGCIMMLIYSAFFTRVKCFYDSKEKVREEAMI